MLENNYHESTGNPHPDDQILRLLLREREQLRREVLWTRNLALCSVVVVLAFLGLAAKSSRVEKIVEAERFILRDADGTARFEIVCDDGSAGFVLRGPDGKDRAVLATKPDGSTIVTFLSKKGTQRIGIGVASDGGAGVNVLDKLGAQAMRLGNAADGSSSLIFLDGTGAERVEVGLSSRGDSQLQTRDRNAKGRISVVTTSEGANAVQLFDRTGVLKQELATASDDGTASWQLCDSEGRPRAILVATPKGSTGLDLLDGAGVHRAAFSLVRETTAITLSDAKGIPNLRMAVSPEGRRLVDFPGVFPAAAPVPDSRPSQGSSPSRNDTRQEKDK